MESLDYISNIFNPTFNVWIDANAGSGKTTALKNRFISLMLSGVSHENIYCITYTNVASEEMKTRILDTLKKWSNSTDDVVAEDLRMIFHSPSLDVVNRAKNLYQKIIDSLEDFRISTIHSLAQRIVGFEDDYILDEKKKLDVIRQNALDAFLALDFTDVQQAAFNLCIQKIGYHTLKDILKQFIAQEYVIGDIFFAKEKEEKPISYYFDILKSMSIPEAGDGKKGQKLVMEFKNAKTPDEIFSACITQKFTPKIIKGFEDFCQQVFNIYQEYLLNNHNIIFNALGKIVPKLLQEYRQLKTKERLISFDECLFKAYKILKENDFSAVRYFFDLNISHLMLDESQDTNPISWKIINKLTEDFFTGSGLHNIDRTMFVVGDKKQSIFSFQGACIEEYDRQKKLLMHKSHECGIKFVEEFLTKSYRCGAEILDCVDKFITDTGFEDAFGNNTKHIAGKEHHSDVKLHLIAVCQDNEEEIYDEDKFNWIKNWHTSNIDKTSSAYIFAEKIKDVIVDKLNKNPQEEILVLFANRTGARGILYNILSILEEYNLPIAGIDRINIRQSICFNDVILLLKVLSNPLYDLDLIAFLRSPFFEISLDDVLKSYQSKPKDVTFFEYLESGSLFTSLSLKKATEQIKLWIDKANKGQIKTIIKNIMFDDRVSIKFVDVYKKEFFSTLTTVFEIIDALPIPQSFSLDCVLKCLMEYEEIALNSVNESCSVKFSTIHSAKGTEADTVIFIESSEVFKANSGGQNQEYILQHADDYFIAMPDLKKLDFYKIISEATKEKVMHEKARLLYVALTRAKKSLHVISDVHHKEKSVASILAEIL